MAHPLVLQLRLTRSEFKRAVAGIPEEDARKRAMPMNCISWTVGHLAWQEQRYFLVYPGGVPLVPEVQENYRYGAPPSTPVLALGHTGLGVFVGDINHEAPYTPGSDG